MPRVFDDRSDNADLLTFEVRLCMEMPFMCKTIGEASLYVKGILDGVGGTATGARGTHRPRFRRVLFHTVGVETGAVFLVRALDVLAQPVRQKCHHIDGQAELAGLKFLRKIVNLCGKGFMFLGVLVGLRIIELSEVFLLC